MIRKYLAVVMFSLYVIYAYIVDRLFILYDKFPELGNIINTCIISPLWEEAVYRYAPIEACLLINKRLIAPITIAVSLLFGFGHDGEISNIYYQGVFGLVLCYVYLNVKRPFLTVFLLHCMWNFLLTTLK